ncbi:MAG: HemK/PrmC family methyltransferase [Gordonia sp. (in: high G+C Gram-positive bacteria)]
MTSAGTPARALLAEGTGTLAAAGVETPRADAEWLLAHVLGIGRGQLLFVDDLDEATRRRYTDLIARRAARVPLQYLTGTAVFGPVEVAVGPGVFIPRPETELLYAWAAARAADLTAPRIVDLCSGSGALALALAASIPDARVDAVEKSPSAARWLRRNVAAAGAAAERITVHVGDVTDGPWLRAALGVDADLADLVVSNPPYVPSAATVSAEVAADPPTAVFGGADGLSVIGPMVGVIATILRPGGWVGIEHDDAGAAGVIDILRGTGASGATGDDTGASAATGDDTGASAATGDDTGGFTEITSHTDLAGRPRFVTARHRGHRSGPIRGSDPV